MTVISRRLTASRTDDPNRRPLEEPSFQCGIRRRSANPRLAQEHQPLSGHWRGNRDRSMEEIEFDGFRTRG